MFRMSAGPTKNRWRCRLVIGLTFVAVATAFAHDDEAVFQRMKKDIFYLASPECEGRGVDTEGINKAAAYIANELKAAGLKPGGKDGTYFQPFVVGQDYPHGNRARIVLGETVSVPPSEPTRSSSATRSTCATSTRVISTVSAPRSLAARTVAPAQRAASVTT